MSVGSEKTLGAVDAAPHTDLGRRPTITTFFPCFNDAGTIASMVLLAEATLRDVASDYEIVVVDDGSTDRSRDVLKEIEARMPTVRVVSHGVNRGYGAALRTGFAAASKDLVFYTDGDFQYDVTQLHRLLEAMTDTVDLVNGYKISRGDPWSRRVLGTAYRHLARRLFLLPIRDVDCDFRLVRRSALDRIRLQSDGGVICVELIKKLRDAGCRFVEVPVRHFPRSYGHSQFFTASRIIGMVVDLARLWWVLVVRKDHLRAR